MSKHGVRPELAAADAAVGKGNAFPTAVRDVDLDQWGPSWRYPILVSVTMTGPWIVRSTRVPGESARRKPTKGEVMTKRGIRILQFVIAVLLASSTVTTDLRAETGQVAVVFTKGGLIVGVGGGEGVLVFRGKRYPFTVSGMSVGFTIGASTTKLVGRALNLSGPGSIEGSYSAIGAGGAVAAGAGGVQLQNANGVILQLSGPKVGAELSAAVGGVTIRLK
jgi:hypothetical protein